MRSSFKFSSYIFSSLFLLFLVGCNSSKSIALSKNNVSNVNRNILFHGEALEMDAAPGGGMAILKDISFDTGTVILDIKGENNPGKSFVGIAFNIQNDTTYEAIYFRPFNFRSSQEPRRKHGIQYVFEPGYSWERLRNEKPGEFEAEYVDPPLPDEWFSISITVKKDSILVRDKNSVKSLLRVRRLTATSSDRIGFWVGNNSNGSFKNLKIK
ncbi:hypothetical protein [Flavimarina sp. Hel_I_48]|uniref:hypothetical protein n=1 Tax=Flavimarina sp. Hel_I_48 TaxID=1392488 RepID=UPI00069149F3|nr:hypothetical protein [Flavimarina sp. Hel_I_48]